MLTYEAAFGCLKSVNAPVLFTDSCAVLDVMRDLTRDTIEPHDRKAALAIIEAMESKTRLVGFLAPQVILELAENLPRVEEEAEKALKLLRTRMKRMDAVNAVYGGSGTTSLAHFDDHVSRAHKLYDRWVAASATANEAPEIAKRAMNRVNLAKTPARKGNASAKDCMVIETYLDIASRLRLAGLTSKFVFISSNTKDYTDAIKRVLKSDLASEFNTMNIEYAPCFGAATYTLGL